MNDHKFINSLLLPVLLILFCCHAHADVFWVSPAGQASWPNARSETPLSGTSCCNMEKANTNATAGDLIYLREGTYNTGVFINPSNSGTSENNRIVYSNYNNETVTITNANNGILIYKKSYITVNGINFVNLKRWMRIYAGHYNTIRYCNFDGRHPDSGAWAGAAIADWNNKPPIGNIIKNNIFYDNKNGTVLYNDSVPTQIVEHNWEQNQVTPGFADLSGNDPDNPLLPDLHLIPQSSARNQGTWLTRITSPNGSGTEFIVEEAGYFMDGWEIIDGDIIQLQGQRRRSKIIRVNYESNTITVNSPLTWNQNDGVSLAYEESAPELGAFEIIPNQPTTPENTKIIRIR